jgi:hypothetical protein
VRPTERQLNRTTLHRQLLLSRAHVPLSDALGRVMALQAQEPASAYLALWNRIAGFDPLELDAAFAASGVVKASLMRITLHAVRADDYLPFQAAMRPSLRASRLFDRRFKESGLRIEEVDDYEPTLLASSSRPRSGPEMVEALAAPFGDRARSAWWAYRTYAAFHHAPTGGPWSFGLRPSFQAAPETLPASEHEASVERLIGRYLRSFGPATVADAAQFTLLTQGVARAALERLGDAVVRLEGPDGADLYDAAGLEVAADGTAPPRLLPMWDSILLAYADRSRVIPDDYRRLVIRRNGDVLPTLLVDGYVAGVWRPRDGAIEATAFEPLGAAAWAGLATEAERLLQLLEPRDPQVYSRFRRWWDALPAAEVRLLPG